jgi:hypothetical protein
MKKMLCHTTFAPLNSSELTIFNTHLKPTCLPCSAEAKAKAKQTGKNSSYAHTND